MNRATKRLLAKQQAAAERLQPRRPAAAAMGTRERDPFVRRTRRFLRDVRAELKKVAWPTRVELLTYTVVVLVAVTFVTLVVFGLDYGFGRLILTVFGN